VIYLAAGLRSACRPKTNWCASGWLELAEALPHTMRLVALDSEERPALGPKGRAPEDALFYAHPRVLNLTGQTPDLRYAMALVDRCALYVGVDTGLLHVAHGLGKPVVNVCASVPDEARAPLVGLKMAFGGKAPCFPCQYVTECPKDSHCLDWVKGKAVAKAVIQLLEKA
jgi:ADP-heptose:LPS heptosyltransferase